MMHREKGVLPHITSRARRSCREDEIESVETDVVKAILLREEYISLLAAKLDKQASKHGKDQAALNELLSILDLLRSVTVDVVEAIGQWRRVRGHVKAPYVWKNVNYLLKIPIDLDFLQKHKVSPLRRLETTSG